MRLASWLVVSALLGGPARNPETGSAFFEPVAGQIGDLAEAPGETARSGEQLAVQYHAAADT